MTTPTRSANDAIATLEKEMARLQQQLDRARERQLDSAQREVMRAQKALDQARAKTSRIQEQLKMARTQVRDNKTAVARRKVERLRTAAADAAQAQADSRAWLRQKKEAVAAIKASLKQVAAVSRAEAAVREQLEKKAARSQQAKARKIAPTGKPTTGPRRIRAKGMKASTQAPGPEPRQSRQVRASTSRHANAGSS